MLVVLNLFPVKIEHCGLWILSNQQKCWKLCQAILEYQIWTVFALYTIGNILNYISFILHKYTFFTKILRPFINFFCVKKGEIKKKIVFNFDHKSFKSTRETWRSEKDTNIWWSFRFVCLSIPDFWDSSSGLTISFLLNLVQNFHQSIGKLQ